MGKSPLAGRVALVTGAAQGIGRAICGAMAEAGAEPLMLDCNARAVRKAAKELGGLAQVADVSSKTSVRRAVREAIKRVGRIDILINNAGVWRWTPILRVTAKDWDAVQAVNVKGILFCCQAVAPIMIGQGGGKIVNVASMAAFGAGHAWGAYCASKAAAVSLTRTLDGELSGYNIQVNGVCPGATDTPMCAQIIRETPGGDSFARMHSPQDVAAEVVALVSPFEQRTSGRIVRMK